MTSTKSRQELQDEAAIAAALELGRVTVCPEATAGGMEPSRWMPSAFRDRQLNNATGDVRSKARDRAQRCEVKQKRWQARRKRGKLTLGPR